MASGTDGVKLYEGMVIRQVTGETLRPGGFSLTEQALQFCAFPAGAKILDVGCGSGATVELLRDRYHLEAVGIDASPVQLERGQQRNPSLPLLLGVGEDLPFASAEMDGVLAECTLSLMTDLRASLREIGRVLRPGAWLVVNDVYARNPEGVFGIRRLKVATCLRGALLQEEFADLLKEPGLEIVLWQDHTELLKQLTGQMIFTYGSMNEFWLKSTAGTVDPEMTQQALRQAKVGYFQLIARKKLRGSEVRS